MPLGSDERRHGQVQENLHEANRWETADYEAASPGAT